MYEEWIGVLDAVCRPQGVAAACWQCVQVRPGSAVLVHVLFTWAPTTYPVE